MQEIQSAFQNATAAPNEPNLLTGRSTSGVTIKMVLRDGKLITAYPLHEDGR
jgi:hypothetical protein